MVYGWVRLTYSYLHQNIYIEPVRKQIEKSISHEAIEQINHLGP